MIIRICNTDYSDRTRLIDRYPKLSKFGYHGEILSDYEYVGKVVINSLEELFSLSKELDREIIVSADHGREPSLEIYDDWRE